MSTDAGVLDMVDLSTIVDIPLTCEHSQHSTAADRHQGDAEWIQYNAECSCDTSPSALVCDKWRKYVAELARAKGLMYCRDCKTSFPAQLMIFERI